MKITIIGGSGFVGSRLIKYLKEQPNEFDLLNIDKRPSEEYPEITEIADVRDEEALTRLLAGTDLVVLLAAEHKDNVSPVSLYYDVNVGGMSNTLSAMEKNGIKRMVFTSSVAVYGLNKKNPSENFPADPFNDYGLSKWQAEETIRNYFGRHPDMNINILRPTVIFGEGNRGNVYNLLYQIASGRFLMIGNGKNLKSMAYVGNIAAFISFLIHQRKEAGLEAYNYVDKPDLNMNDLVTLTGKALHKHIPSIHFPYWLGMAGGYCFDLLSKTTGKKLRVSSVRVKKFCAVTQFDASKTEATGFEAPFKLEEGLKRTLKYEFEQQ